MSGLSNRLKEWRERVGLTQGQLAAAAGIQRQTIGNIEAGRHGPGLEVGLRLAAALGCCVEDLFQLADRAPALPVCGLPAGLAPGTRVALAEIGGRLWARPLADLGGAGLPTVPAHGILDGAGCVRACGGAVPGIFLSGCDPGLGLLAGHLRRGGVEAFWWEAGNGEAARQLASGATHAAAGHGAEDERPDAPFALAGFRLGGWELGWMVAPGNPLGIRTAADLGRPGVRLANREAGAGARRLLDGLLRAAGVSPARVVGYGTELAGHATVAQAIALGAADVAIGVGAVAQHYGLDFLPLRAERSTLWLPADSLETRAAQCLLEALAAGAFRRELAAFGPYDTSETGDRVA